MKKTILAQTILCVFTLITSLPSYAGGANGSDSTATDSNRDVTTVSPNSEARNMSTARSTDLTNIDDINDNDYGLIGLIGLLGLTGLMRKKRVDTNRPLSR